MSFTQAQQTAIDSTKNTVVVAGAGAGKTRTLVERCVKHLLDRADPVGIDEMLIVTFTESAAGEMRHRIQERLEKELEAHPGSERLLQQTALLDAACISTLHSFCWKVIREHFYELDLDPGAVVLQEEQAAILFAETVDEVLREHYEGGHKNSSAVQKYILEYENGRDGNVRKLIRKIHEFTQSRPDPAGWFEKQHALLAKKRPDHWRLWMEQAFQEWCEWWLPLLRGLPLENSNVHQCVKLLESVCENPSLETLARVIDRDENGWPKGKKGALRAPVEKFFDTFKMLAEFASDHALEDDWNWSRESLVAVLGLAEQFEQHYAQVKRDRGVVDFHDLEQLALQILWDHKANVPTDSAKGWQERFKLVFVDEYQDINQAQDLILQAVSRSGNGGNRFLVGDIKQSIYRFRQADPGIFRTYIGRKGWEQCDLTDNFRSHQAILEFVNPFFEWLMQKQVGGIEYDQNARLKFGKRPAGEEMSTPQPVSTQVEVHLVSGGNGETSSEDEEESEPSAAELEDAEKEARIVARRLRELHEGEYQIFEEKEKKFRKVEFSDMVVLLRAPASKAEAYARAFDGEGVPLQLKRNVFYSEPEVADLVNLLTILDNPLQDIPYIAVLRSPLAGLSANELALVRVVNRQLPFALAVNRFVELKRHPETIAKLQLFLERFHRWRKEGINSSLSQRLEAILAETHYDDWIKAQRRGAQRYANIQKLVQIARQFDELKGEGLYQFVRHVQELQEEIGDIEPAPLEALNAVRLMSVHQSKGLEFPVVVVADMAKKIDFRDAHGATILHEKYGLCAKIKPPGKFQMYNSLPLVLARQEEKIATVAEEMRLFYVALTRAKNLLICSGVISQKAMEKWDGEKGEKPHAPKVLQHGSWLNQLGTFLQRERAGWHNEPNGHCRWWNWKVHAAPVALSNLKASALGDPAPLNAEDLAQLKSRFDWKYPFEPSTVQPAKTSVTQLRRDAVEAAEEASAAKFVRESGRVDGAERGLAHHHFLEHLDLHGPLTEEGLGAQASALAEQGVLSQEELASLDFAKLARFWSSAVGTVILANLQHLHRELPFTFRVSRTELSALPAGILPNVTADEFVIVQGIADLVIIKPEEIWLLDFKTDGIQSGGLLAAGAYYRPQLDLYAAALSAIYQKSVTKKWLHFFATGQTLEI